MKKQQEYDLKIFGLIVDNFISQIRNASPEEVLVLLGNLKEPVTADHEPIPMEVLELLDRLNNAISSPSNVSKPIPQELLSQKKYEIIPLEGPDLLNNLKKIAAPISSTAILLIEVFLLCQQGREWLIQNRQLLHNWSKVTVQAGLHDTSIFWDIAYSSLGRQFLIHNPQVLQNCDWNCAPKQGRHKGKSMLWFFTISEEGRQFLFQNPKLLQNCNWDAVASEGNLFGVTALWFFTYQKDWQQMIIQNPELFQNCNWNATPPDNHQYRNVSILWLLGSTEDGLQFLIENPHLLKNCNWEAAPTVPPNNEITLMRHFSQQSRGREFLKDHPEFLKNKLNLTVQEDLLMSEDYLIDFLKMGVFEEAKLKYVLDSQLISHRSLQIIIKYLVCFKEARGLDDLAGIAYYCNFQSWLAHIRDNDGNTLLHAMILQLNITIPLNRQELLQEHKKLFFDLLAHCRSVCNRAGNRPADLANDSFIQALFSENLSFLQVEKKLENRKAVESAVKKFLTNYTLSEKQHNGLSESETKDNEQVVSLKK